MQPVEDPAFDPKAFVSLGYDRCAEEITAARGATVPSWLRLLTERLPDRSSVLDIGCGGGVPIARTLAERFTVTGIDISARQIQLARQNVPGAVFVQSDIMDQAFAPDSYDAVVMLYTLFHLPRGEHAELLQRISRWLHGDGFLLATLAYDGHPGYTEDFYGTSMYWSHFAEEDYRPLLKQAGFSLPEIRKIVYRPNNGSEADAEVHPLILARKN